MFLEVKYLVVLFSGFSSLGSSKFISVKVGITDSEKLPESDKSKSVGIGTGVLVSVSGSDDVCGAGVSFFCLLYADTVPPQDMLFFARIYGIRSSGGMSDGYSGPDISGSLFSGLSSGSGVWVVFSFFWKKF